MSDRLFSPSSCVGSLPLRRLSLGICRVSAMPQRPIAGNFAKLLQDQSVKRNA
jgi:hypothetical protein